MALEDIDRLREKLEKDPASKLFVPLAEEYKKVGMIDEAIEVLQKGLENNPGYMSARVSLGKVYLEKGMLNEASAEFGKVVSAIPDNLYAHKKLAEIYRELGERDKAISEYREVLNLNPRDEESAKSLADLEGTFTVHPEVTKVVKSMLSKERPSEVPVSKAFEEEVEKLLEVEEAQREIVAGPEEIQEEKIPSTEAVVGESEVLAEEIEETQKTEVSEKPKVNIDEADLLIDQGKYAEAIEVYREILSNEPDNVRVLQRIEELKALLKHLGKDKEDLVARLNRFLGGIKKRGNEFLGIPEID